MDKHKQFLFLIFFLFVKESIIHFFLIRSFLPGIANSFRPVVAVVVDDVYDRVSIVVIIFVLIFFCFICFIIYLIISCYFFLTLFIKLLFNLLFFLILIQPQNFQTLNYLKQFTTLQTILWFTSFFSTQFFFFLLFIYFQ